MKPVFIAEPTNRQIVTMDFCEENMHCERVITFVCDSAHKRIIVSCVRPNSSLEMPAIFTFSEPPTGLHFGIRNGEYGLFVFFDKKLTLTPDLETISKMWREDWFNNISKYDIRRCDTPKVYTEAELNNHIWIGEEAYYGPRN